MINITNLRCEYMPSPINIEKLNPCLSYISESDKRCLSQKAYQIIVSSSKEKLVNSHGDLWDSGKVESDESVQIEYKGQELKSFMRCWWKVRIWDKDDKQSKYSETALWEMGLLNKNEWMAKWIGLDSSNIAKDSKTPENVGKPSPYLRHTFKIEKKIKEARVYSTALGLYNLYLNGKKIGCDELAPGWTDYNKRIQYQTYDITKTIKTGLNSIGAVLGDGWYAGNIAITGRCQYGDYPLLFLLQIRIDYEDGTIGYIVSDETWKGNTGPIRYSDLQCGEYYDAEKELEGWNDIEYDDSQWLSLKKYDLGYERLVAQIGPPVKVMKEIKSISINSLNSHTYIIDMGQNMVGRVLLKVTGPRGTKVRLRFGEMLNIDGSLYTENLRTADQTDIYILKGGSVEYYEPSFTFHGFRYIELTGYPGVLDVNSIIGHVLHSDLSETMNFKCSNEMINKLYENILWGQRGNFLSIPTDCPQRDERMGWTGDGQIFARTACFNMDCSGFFNKWVNDIMDAQQETGAFTDVVPNVRKSDGTNLVGSGNAAWGDAGIIIPWTLYLCYGDKKVIRENYENIRKYIKYLLKNSNNYIRPDLGYGDWLNIDAETPKDLMGTAYFAYVVKIMSKIAKILGRISDLNYFENLFQNIKMAFNDAYVMENGRIKGETQTGYLLALKAELLDENIKKLSAEHLVQNIRSRDWHLSTGFVGVSYLLPMLSDYGFDEAAYRLLLCDTYPSWLYSIKNGATTIWERWNSYTIENGFGDIGMNSFNHYSLGSVAEWLYRYCAGIDIEDSSPGYKKLIIKPHPGGNLSFIDAEYLSVHGVIKCCWKIEKDSFRLDITIPGNTRGKVYLPYGNRSTIQEGGLNVEEVKEIKILGFYEDYMVLDIGSGSYEFKCLL